MAENSLFDHFFDDINRLLREGVNSKELIEVLAAVSVDLALNVAPDTEQAYLAIFDGIRNMTSAHVELNSPRDEEEVDESELLSNVEVDDEKFFIESNSTVH